MVIRAVSKKSKNHACFIALLYDRADELPAGAIASVIRATCGKKLKSTLFEHSDIQWRPVVKSTIDDADTVLLFSSINIKESNLVNATWANAVERGKEIVIVLLDSSYIPDELSAYPCVDLRHLITASQLKHMQISNNPNSPKPTGLAFDAVDALKATSDIFACLKELSICARESVCESRAELSWKEIQPVSSIELQIDSKLIPMLHNDFGNRVLYKKIRQIRRSVSQELGILLPEIEVRHVSDLPDNSYRICLHGVQEAEALIYPDCLLALSCGSGLNRLDRAHFKSPIYGQDALWIELDERADAETRGYSVMDPGSVIACHLGQVLRHLRCRLLGYEETYQLLEYLAKSQPSLVRALVPGALSLAQVTAVLRQLLEEQVSIRDFKNIAEILLSFAQETQDPQRLSAKVRSGLSRRMLQLRIGDKTEIPAIVLDWNLERMLLNLQESENSLQAYFDYEFKDRLAAALTDAIDRIKMKGEESLLLVQPDLRRWVTRFTLALGSGISVFSYEEIPNDYQVNVLEYLKIDATKGAKAS